jgi:hypothetical protein
VSNVIRINAVAFEEGDAWVVQGVEYDIVAHADDVRKLPDAFARAVLENMTVTEHLGRRPLEGIKAAPQRFREMFDTAIVELKSLAGPGIDQVRPEVAVRLAEVA